MQMIAWLRTHRVLANLYGAAICFALLGYALYAQHGLGLEPCPLCIFQRFGILALGIAFLLGVPLSLPRARIAGYLAVFLVVLAAAAAIAVAGRHVWIQSQPPGSVPACGATLDYLWEVFPVMEVLRKVFYGSGECSSIDWSFLGISMPGWVLLWAVLLGACGVLVNWPRRRAAAG